MTDKTTDNVEENDIDKGMIRVFVYGTLKDGHANHGLLDHDDVFFLGYDSITGPYRMLNLGAIPGVVHAPDANNTMFGELYAMAPEHLASLDLLEGHPNFYRRQKVWTDHLTKRAWVYCLQAQNVQKHAVETDYVNAGMWRPSQAELLHWKANGSKDD